MNKCTACWLPIEGPRLLVTADGFERSRMNGITFALHPSCMRMVFPPDNSGLLPRVSDPVAEAEEWDEMVAAR